METFGAKLACGVLLLALGCGLPLMADVVVTRDGTVVIGTLKSASVGTVKYTSFGKEVVLQTTEIIRAETSLAAAKDLFLEIKLNDGSILKGTISDYDEEIGLFIDMGFGVITIPIGSIAAVYQPKQRQLYQGASAGISAGFSVMAPLGERAADFGPSLGGGLNFDFAIPGLRGLFVGAGVNALFFDYKVDSAIKYSSADICARLTWKLIEARTESSIAAWFAPFVSLGGGAAFINVADNRAGAANRSVGSVNGAARAQLGLEITPIANLSINLSGEVLTLFEAAGPFWQLGGQCSIGVLF